MTYEEFKTMNDEMFATFGLKVKSLKTGKQNPRYCIMIDGHRAKRITAPVDYYGPTTIAEAKKSSLPIIPEEIRKIAIGFIKRGRNQQSLWNDVSNDKTVIGTEGLSGTEWVSYRSIRLTTEQWEDLEEQWSANKKIEFLLSLS